MSNKKILKNKEYQNFLDLNGFVKVRFFEKTEIDKIYKVIKELSFWKRVESNKTFIISNRVEESQIQTFEALEPLISSPLAIGNNFD